MIRTFNTKRISYVRVMCTVIFFRYRCGNSSIGSYLPNPLAFCSESSFSLVMPGPYDEKTRGVKIFRLLKSCFVVDVCTNNSRLHNRLSYYGFISSYTFLILIHKFQVCNRNSPTHVFFYL